MKSKSDVYQGVNIRYWQIDIHTYKHTSNQASNRKVPVWWQSEYRLNPGTLWVHWFCADSSLWKGYPQHPLLLRSLLEEVRGREFLGLEKLLPQPIHKAFMSIEINIEDSSHSSKSLHDDPCVCSNFYMGFLTNSMKIDSVSDYTRDTV